MAALRIVGFASGSPLSIATMKYLARSGELVAVVMPEAARAPVISRVSAFLRPKTNPLADMGVPLIRSDELTRFAPDLIVIASFPTILPHNVYAQARRGALNIHMGLLPRHRGWDPVFWTYFDNDAQAGVTVHWVKDGVDDGDIAAQRAVSLERGQPSRTLYSVLTKIAVILLDDVLGSVRGGNEPRTVQDSAEASHETKADTLRAVVPFAEWPAERVWHVVSGLGDQRHTLIADANGVRLRHGRATEFIHGDCVPGRIERASALLTLHCMDGRVRVEPDRR